MLLYVFKCFIIYLDQMSETKDCSMVGTQQEKFDC